MTGIRHQGKKNHAQKKRSLYFQDTQKSPQKIKINLLQPSRRSETHSQKAIWFHSVLWLCLLVTYAASI